MQCRYAGEARFNGGVDNAAIYILPIRSPPAAKSCIPPEPRQSHHNFCGADSTTWEALADTRHDTGSSPAAFANRALRYVVGILLAPYRLRGLSARGRRVRAIGSPIVENAGYIGVGDEFVINSRYAPCELITRSTGRISIGNRVALNFGSTISAAGTINIGDDVNIGPHCILLDHEPPGGSTVTGLTIGDGAWLEGRVTLSPGVNVGAGAIVMVGSIVTTDIPPGMVAGGIPARIIRSVRHPAA